MNAQIRALSAVSGRASIAARSYAMRVALLLPAATRRDSLIIAIILVYWLCGLIVAELADIPPQATVTTYLLLCVKVTTLMVILMVIGRGSFIMIHDRPARPLTQLWLEIRTSLVTPERIAHAMPIVLVMPVLASTFTVIKMSIPFFAPFSWDTTFEKWDRWLHGGVAPWELIQPILGSPDITYGLNWAYIFWFQVQITIWAYMAFSQRDDLLRRQFFLTLVLGWILIGNVAAMLFSSVGPCFFGNFAGLPDPFAPLMQYLNDANQVHPLWALATQEALLQAYATNTMGVGVGLSAMPSVHVAMATLFALVCWRIRRWLGIVLSIYAVVIMVGSVHLGWHYAIDGYAGAAGMIAIWWVVGRVLDRQSQSAARRATVQAV